MPKTMSRAVTPSRQAALEVLEGLARPDMSLGGKGAQGSGIRTAADRPNAGELLEEAFSAMSLSKDDRALATELTYGVLRWQGYLDGWIGAFSAPPLRRLPPKVLLALRLAFYQLLLMERIPKSAAVDTAVQWVKVHLGIGPARLVNAILREAVRHPERFRLPDPDRYPVDHLAVRYAHPVWMVRRWLDRLGWDRTVALLSANNEVPPLTLRVNPAVLSREALMEEVRSAGGTAVATTVSSLGVIIRGVSLRALSSYEVGGFYVQDEAAQLIVDLLDPRPGEQVLDTCAAPGGKTTHLAERLAGRGAVTAWETHPRRLRLLEENLRRMRSPAVRVQRADAVRPPEGETYDRILVDAPCSALGILRRAPEGKWRKSEELIGRCAALQGELLSGVASLLRPGGRLVYATCSTEPEENEAVVSSFLSAHRDFERAPARLPAEGARLIDSQGYFNTLLNPHRMDFFFAACLVKRRGDGL